MGVDILIGTTGICELESHVFLLPEVREMTSLGARNLFQKLLRNAGFSLLARDLSIGCLEFIYVYIYI